MRGVQPLPAQQRADLTRSGACLRLAQDPQLVLGREAPARRPLEELRVRRPLRRGAPAGRLAPLAYGSLREAADSPIQLHLQHPSTTPISPSGSVISSSRPSHTSLAERGYAADVIYPRHKGVTFNGQPYWSPDCYENGPLDLTPGDGVWP